MIISCIYFHSWKSKPSVSQETAYPLRVGSLLYYFFRMTKAVFLTSYFFFDKSFAVYY